jgi:hypothetical protein
MTDRNEQTFAAKTITAWQCIGCGRLEAPQTCIGVCLDRKVELVSAWDHAEALVALEDANERIGMLETLLAKLARTTPREDGWKQSFLAFQADARKALGLSERLASSVSAAAPVGIGKSSGAV